MSELLTGALVPFDFEIHVELQADDPRLDDLAILCDNFAHMLVQYGFKLDRWLPEDSHLASGTVLQ